MDFFVDSFVVMNPENPYSASRAGIEAKSDAILVFPAFVFSRKKKSWLNICTTQRSVVQIHFIKEKLGSWTDTQPINPPTCHGKKITIPLDQYATKFVPNPKKAYESNLAWSWDNPVNLSRSHDHLSIYTAVFALHNRDAQHDRVEGVRHVQQKQQRKWLLL